jgi:hypothetical protein
VFAGTQRGKGRRSVMVGGQADVDGFDFGIFEGFPEVMVLFDSREIHLFAGPAEVALDATQVARELLVVARNHGGEFRFRNSLERFEMRATHEAEADDGDLHKREI